MRDGRLAELDTRDKNFIRKLVLNTLRHMGEIDHFLHQFTRNRDNLLRLGVAQLKFMDMPAHAVVNEMVELGHDKGHKSFLNSVLRKAVDKELKRNIKLNFPKWMSGSWKKAYGADKAEAIMEIMLTESGYVDLSYKGGKNERLMNPPPIVEIDGFTEGDWWVQDLSQTHAAQMLGDVNGKSVLDICAAPGGKTAQLIDAGAVVTALDSSEKKLERLRENLDRLKMNCEIICADGREFNSDNKFDFILLDAPCTATGTIRRHPEILHQRELNDVAEMVKIQNALLANAHNLLKDDGELVYSTCSLQYEECEGLVKKLTNWELVEEKRILPCDCEGGIGGAYCAGLRKSRQ